MAAASQSLLFRYGYAAALLIGGAAAVAMLASFRNGLLYLIGAGLGMAMVAGGIGFTGSWRAFIVRREARGLLVTLLLLALATLAFIPTLASVPDTLPNLAPVGLSLFIGALLFGIGMQLGNGCGSGTLVGGGKGSAHSMLVILGFLPGSLIGSIHMPWWLGLPAAGSAVSLPDLLGPSATILVQLLGIGILALAAARLARRADPDQPLLPSRGQWIGMAAVVLLALAALMVSGRMWSITFGYTLWGAKIADLGGLPVARTEFWSTPFAAESLGSSVLADITSVMNLGLLAGVAALTLMRDELADRSIHPRRAAAALAGGLLMGYGARLAFGCNIGALFSGSASGSLHAWFWLLAAWVGCHIGIRIRPRFGMAN